MEHAAASPISAAILHLDSRDSQSVVRAFALLGLLARLAGCAATGAAGIGWLALAQALGALVYLLVLLRFPPGRTDLFLAVLGPEWILWGFAMALAYGPQPFFHLHSIFVTAGILLLLHDLPTRQRVVLFLLPVALPIPFMALLLFTAPQIDLAPATTDVMLFANQLTGLAFLLAVCGLAMLDHARARRLAEDRAEAQTRLVEDLSHELRTPIATVLTAAQGARAIGTAPEPIAQSLEWIEDSGRAAGRLIERMLDLATLERGWLPEPRPEALLQAVRKAVERLRPLAATRSLEIRFRPVAVPETAVDAVSLEIVLQNLITNALAHSPAGGSVEVRLVERAGTSRIEVEDHGDGIAAEDLPRIFDRMWRADQVRSRGEGRHGLGLAIARRHATLIGATIEVQSEIGRGSVFSVVFG